MEKKTKSEPAINKLHVNTGPSFEEQAGEQQQLPINKIDESEAPLTDKNNPGKNDKE